MLINKQLAQADIIALNPCGLGGDDNGTNYTPMRIARLFSGADTITLGDVLTMDEISIADRLWVVLKKGVLPEKVRVGLGCDYAERVLFIAESWAGNRGRSRLALETTRKWLRGEATDEDRSAYADAADAASHAADAASAAAFHAAAYVAEREWQLARTIKVLSEAAQEGGAA